MQKVYILTFVMLLLFCNAGKGHSQDNSIVFSSNRSGNYEIYTMRADGSNLKRLTNRSGDDIQPAWSPNGKSIIYASDYYGDFDIYSMSADGTNPQLLTTSNADDIGPAISPQGNFIAFHTYRDGNWEIYVMNKDGTNKHNITNNTVTDRYPSWSPDGSFLVYHTRLDSGNWEIFKRQADGSNPVNLTNHFSNDYYPAISPDGQHVTFESNRTGSWQIHLMSPDGSDQKLLPVAAAQPDWSGRVAWSPDSKTVLFPQSHDLYSMRLNGTGLTNITNAAGIDRDPNWLREKFPWATFLPAILYGAQGSGEITDPQMKEDIEKKLDLLLTTFSSFSGDALSEVTTIFSDQNVVTITPDLSSISSIEEIPEIVNINVDFGTGYTAEDGSMMAGSAQLTASNITYSESGMGADFTAVFNNIRKDGVSQLNGSLSGGVHIVGSTSGNNLLLTGNLNFNHLQTNGQTLSGNIQISGSFSSLELSNQVESIGDITLTFSNYTAGDYTMTGTVNISADGSGQALVTTNLHTNEGPVNMPMIVTQSGDKAMTVNTTAPGTLGPYTVSVNNLRLDNNICAKYPSGGSASFTKGGVKGIVTFTSSCDGKYRYRER